MTEELLLNLFLKIKTEHISGLVSSSFIQFAFIACQIDGYRNILKLSCRPLAFTLQKLFKETKRGLELASLLRLLYF